MWPFTSGPVVPVLRFTGPIGMATPLRQGLSLAAVAGAIDRAFKLSRLPSVAVVINSPGGSPVQSSLIFKRLRQMAERVREIMGTVPGVADIETVRIITPDHFKDTLNSNLGSAFSLEPTLRQSAWFRVHNRDDRIPGLYFVGAGTHPGAGIPGVVSSARATAGVMMEDMGLA